MAVKKSKKKQQELKPVPVAEAKVGQTISLHGEILSTKRIKGRSLWSKWATKGKGKVRKFRHSKTQPGGFKIHTEGREGILFTTTTGEYFYALDSNVWMVS